MKKYDNKQYYSLPQWVRKLCQDVYGVDPNDPTFINDYTLNEPLQYISSQALSYFASDNVIGENIRILKNWIVINGNKVVKVDDFIVDPSGKLYKVNAIDNEYYYINFVANLKGDKGDVGETIKIYGDLYDQNNPLPSFEDALIGAYLFLDSEGKYDLYVKNTSATAWVVIDDWGGVPGPQGAQGIPGPQGAGSVKYFYSNQSQTKTITISQIITLSSIPNGYNPTMGWYTAILVPTSAYAITSNSGFNITVNDVILNVNLSHEIRIVKLNRFGTTNYDYSISYYDHSEKVYKSHTFVGDETAYLTLQALNAVFYVL